MGFLFDMLRGYLYFSREASKYILVVCGCISIPLAGLCLLAYVVWMQTQ